MKKIIFMFLVLVSVFSLTSCSIKKVVPDYDSIILFEKDLNNNVDVVDKTVEITVDDYSPSSVFGYNIMTGVHLNFVSEKNPKVEIGDTLIVKVKTVRKLMDSYIITYKKVK